MVYINGEKRYFDQHNITVFKIILFAGLFFILTFCLNETAKAKGYSAGAGINTAVGAESSNGTSGGTSGNTAGHGRGSSRSETGQRLDDVG